MPEDQSKKNYESIMEYLELSYSGAKAMDDVETMCRLSRAMLAFSYDDLEHMPTWEEMQDAFIQKDLSKCSISNQPHA